MASALNCLAILLLMATMAAGSSCVYNYDTEICCNGRRHHMPVNYYEMTCCNQDLITYTEDDLNDPTVVKQFCCNDVVRDMPDHDHWECCDTEVIDTEAFFCFEGEKVAISDDDKAANKYGKCGTDANALESYNYAEEICCDGALLPVDPLKANTTFCCGSSTYDVNDSLCCNDTAVNVEDMIEPYCCGDQAYDYNNSVCCNDQVIPVEDKTCEYCCGSSSYNYHTDLCCNQTVYNVGNTTYMSCCGNEPYNYQESICCYDKLYNEDPTDKSCCGSETYDLKTQVCSYDWKPLEENDGTSGNQYKSEVLSLDGRDPATTAACHGEFMDTTTQVCCDSGPKDTEGQTVEGCCGDEFISNYSAQSCCGSKVYDVISQRCFRDKVVNVGTDEEMCYYNGEAYNLHSQRCCSQSIVDYTHDDKLEGREYCCEEYVPYVASDEENKSAPIDD